MTSLLMNTRLIVAILTVFVLAAGVARINYLERRIDELQVALAGKDAVLASAAAAAQRRASAAAAALQAAEAEAGQAKALAQRLRARRPTGADACAQAEELLRQYRAEVL